MPNKKQLLELLEIVKEKGNVDLLNEYETYESIINASDDDYIKMQIKTQVPFDNETMRFVMTENGKELRWLIETKQVSLENLKQLAEELEKMDNLKYDAIKIACGINILGVINEGKADFNYILDVIKELKKASSTRFYDLANSNKITDLIKKGFLKPEKHVEMLKILNSSKRLDNSSTVSSIALNDYIIDWIENGNFSPDVWLEIMNVASNSENEQEYVPMDRLISNKAFLNIISVYENRDDVLLNIVDYIDGAISKSNANSISTYLSHDNAHKLIRSGFKEELLYNILDKIANFPEEMESELSDNINSILNRNFINLVLNEEISKTEYSFYSRELFEVRSKEEAQEKRESLKEGIKELRLKSLENVIRELKEIQNSDIPQAIQRKRI